MPDVILLHWRNRAAAELRHSSEQLLSSWFVLDEWSPLCRRLVLLGWLFNARFVWPRRLSHCGVGHVSVLGCRKQQHLCLIDPDAYNILMSQFCSRVGACVVAQCRVPMDVRFLSDLIQYHCHRPCYRRDLILIVPHFRSRVRV